MRTRSKVIIAMIIAAFVIAGAIIAIGYFFKVDMKNGITYVGSKHYSDEELTERIFGDHVNAFTYSLSKADHVTIPFVQRYEVEVEWPNRLNVTVYEKPIIGYVRYMGSNMYFDREGIVIESSDAAYSNIPQITGINFDSIILGQKLQIDKTEVYGRIAEFLQDFDKNSLKVDRIHFDSTLNATLYIGNVRVMLGGNENQSEKIHELTQVYPKLVGLSGVLHMEEFEPDNPRIFFNKDE